MKTALSLFLLLLVALPAWGAPPPPSPSPLTKEEEARKEELLKNNPQLREQVEANEKKGLRIKSIKDNKITLDPITGEKVAPKETPPGTAAPGEAAAVAQPAAAPPPVEEPKFMGNANLAADAYKKKDYKTALDNYRALARDGDPKATLMVGIMQQEGQGMKKDKAAAYAWYGRAADMGDGTAKQIVRGMNDNDELSNKEQKEAANQYKELSKEFDKPNVAENASDRFEDVQGQTNVNTRDFGGMSPKSHTSGDSRSTKRPPTYTHEPAKTGKDKDFNAGTYDQPSDN